MKRLLATIPAIFIGLSAHAADIYENKKIQDIRLDPRPCLLFRLEGVDKAANSDSPWFAIRQDHANKNTIHSALLAAKIADRPITVQADGTIINECGHAEAQAVIIP